MVSPLEYKRKDPNRKGRGAGYYYKRNSYKRGWFSKYDGGSLSKDALTPANRRKNPRYQHAGDRVPNRMTYKKFLPSGRKTKKKIFGFL